MQWIKSYKQLHRSVYSDSLDLMVIFCVEQISKHMLAVGTTTYLCTYFRVFIKFSLEKGITIKSRIFKNRELYWSNLPQNSNFGRELVQKSGVQIPVGEGQNFLSRFLFIFIFSIKNWILTHKILFFIFFYQLNINKNRCIEQILFYFYVTC